MIEIKEYVGHRPKQINETKSRKVEKVSPSNKGRQAESNKDKAK